MRALLTAILGLSIWVIGSADAADVRDLLGKLKSNDAEVRRAAAKELAEIGPEAKSAVPILTKTLRDKDLFVRQFSAEALGSIGEEAKSAVPALALAMNDPRKEVAGAAADALGKVGPSGVAALTAAVKDGGKDPSIRKKAAMAMAKNGEQARSAVPALSQILSGKAKGGKKVNDDDIRIEVATALGSIAKSDDAVAIKALKSVSEGKQRNRALQKAAGDSLRQITGMGPAKRKKNK